MPDWLARQHGVDLDKLKDASDPDGAAERERAREEQAEKERAERRQLIALNKLGEAAEAVRREWVRHPQRRCMGRHRPAVRPPRRSARTARPQRPSRSCGSGETAFSPATSCR